MNRIEPSQLHTLPAAEVKKALLKRGLEAHLGAEKKGPLRVGDGEWAMQFDKGWVVLVGVAVYVMDDLIFDRWRIAAWLGMPRADTVSDGTARKSQFGGGWIYLNGSAPAAFAIEEVMHTAWQAAGGAAIHGFPASEPFERSARDGTSQLFEAGQAWRAKDGSVSWLPRLPLLTVGLATTFAQLGLALGIPEASVPSFLKAAVGGIGDAISFDGVELYLNASTPFAEDGGIRMPLWSHPVDDHYGSAQAGERLKLGSDTSDWRAALYGLTLDVLVGMLLTSSKFVFEPLKISSVRSTLSAIGGGARVAFQVRGTVDVIGDTEVTLYEDLTIQPNGSVTSKIHTDTTVSSWIWTNIGTWLFGIPAETSTPAIDALANDQVPKAALPDIAASLPFPYGYLLPNTALKLWFSPESVTVDVGEATSIRFEGATSLGGVPITSRTPSVSITPSAMTFTAVPFDLREPLTYTWSFSWLAGQHMHGSQVTPPAPPQPVAMTISVTVIDADSATAHAQFKMPALGSGDMSGGGDGHRIPNKNPRKPLPK